MRYTTILASAIAFFATASVASADILDDNLAKAEKSVANAEKKLAAAQACVIDEAARAKCKADMRAKAEKSLANAQKRLAAID
jgi:hypothetical protein